MDEDQMFITQEGYERFTKELKMLRTERRREIAERIQVAKEFGDLSENAEYVAAIEEQAFVEGRIAELEIILKTAIVVQQTSGSTTITIGSRIKVDMDGNERTYEIVGSHEADPIKGKISHESPMGKSFIGKKRGDTFEIEVPKGKIRIEILDIE